MAPPHRAEHWFFYEGGRNFHSDVNDARYLGLYGPAMPRRMPGEDHDNQPDIAYMNNWLARTTEIVDNIIPKSCGSIGGLNNRPGSHTYRNSPRITTTAVRNGIAK